MRWRDSHLAYYPMHLLPIFHLVWTLDILVNSLKYHQYSNLLRNEQSVQLLQWICIPRDSTKSMLTKRIQSDSHRSSPFESLALEARLDHILVPQSLHQARESFPKLPASYWHMNCLKLDPRRLIVGFRVQEPRATVCPEPLRQWCCLLGGFLFQRISF